LPLARSRSEEVVYDSVRPMRFCPFCGAENADDSGVCTACARKLPAAVVRKPSVGAGSAPAGPTLPSPASVVGPASTAVKAIVGPKPRAATPSSPPPLPSEAGDPGEAIESTVVGVEPFDIAPLPPPPQVPPPPADRATSHPNGKNGFGGASVATVGGDGDSRLEARAADGSRPVPTPTPTPYPRYSREVTASELATRVVQLPEIEEARKNLSPVPSVPDAGLFDAARYAVQFARSRWQRKKAIEALTAEVLKETASLDVVLGELGAAARRIQLEGRAFADENQALDEADRRRVFAEQSCEDLTGKKADENAKFETVQHDLAARLSERESILAEVSAELARLDGQRRGLRERKKDVEKRLKGLLKSAGEREEQAEKSQMGDSRQTLRESAAEMRREARGLDDEKNDIDARLAGLEKPIADVTTRHEQARADVDLSKRDLQNAREGHRHRIAEIEAETARRFRELQQSESEIARRLVTLGTIVNLNRVDSPELSPLFERGDQLRGLISARESEIDRLTAEQHAFDRPSLFRGGAVLIGGFLLLVSVVWIAVTIAHRS
jgi:hypothetical protein